MKKYIGILGVLTILSGCGTKLDFWSKEEPNPLITTKRPPALNIGGAAPPPPIDGGMGMPMIPPPPAAYGANAPDGRRAPKFNNQQFASAPIPEVSQQPIGIVDPYQQPPVAVPPPPLEDYGMAVVPPPPPPLSSTEFAAQTNADSLRPVGEVDLAGLQEELGSAQPVKVVVPVRSPNSSEPSTNFQDLRPINDYPVAKRSVDSDGYPVLADIPPPPSLPIPFNQDSRIKELRQDYAENQPVNTLMPQGPTVVVGENQSQTYQSGVSSGGSMMNRPIDYSSPYGAGSTNVADLSQISSVSYASVKSYNPILPQSRYASWRNKVRNAVRY